MANSYDNLIAPGLIDSRLKLHLLLLFHRHPRMAYTAAGLSERLCEAPWVVETAVDELAICGFLERAEPNARPSYRLGRTWRRALDRLGAAYDDPLRRELLYELVRAAERERAFRAWNTQARHPGEHAAAIHDILR